MSRSPVRKALSQLVSEGLLEQRPRSGTYVKKPARRDLEELYAVREPLEQYAAQEATGRISPEAVARLRDLCAELHSLVVECRASPAHTARGELLRQVLANDLAFHRVILEACGNGLLKRLVTDSKILTQVFAFVQLEHDVPVLSVTDRGHRR